MSEEVMKKYLAVLGLVFCVNSFADNPMKTISGHYMISHIISEVPEQTYSITPVPTDRGFAYGNNIKFDPTSLTFESYYTAPCGNDCFPSSRGTYQMEGEQHVRLHLTNVAQRGFCDGYDKTVQQDLGVFLIEVNQESSAITLTFSGQ